MPEWLTVYNVVAVTAGLIALPLCIVLIFAMWGLLFWMLRDICVWVWEAIVTLSEYFDNE